MKTGFFYKMLCNDQNQPSATRVLLFFVVFALLSWTNLIVCQTNKLTDIPQGWLWMVGAFSGTIMTGYVKTAYMTGSGTAKTDPEILLPKAEETKL